MYSALVRFLYPLMQKELHSKLLLEAKEHVLRVRDEDVFPSLSLFLFLFISFSSILLPPLPSSPTSLSLPPRSLSFFPSFLPPSYFPHLTPTPFLSLSLSLSLFPSPLLLCPFCSYLFTLMYSLIHAYKYICTGVSRIFYMCTCIHCMLLHIHNITAYSRQTTVMYLYIHVHVHLYMLYMCVIYMYMCMYSVHVHVYVYP